MYYRFTDDLELSGNYSFGYGTAVYQATTRYQIKDFYFNQPSLKLKGKNFFIRHIPLLKMPASRITWRLPATICQPLPPLPT